MKESNKEAISRDVLRQIRFQTRIERLSISRARRELSYWVLAMAMCLSVWSANFSVNDAGHAPLLSILRGMAVLAVALCWLLANLRCSFPLIAALIQLPLVWFFYPEFGVLSVGLVVVSGLVEMLAVRWRVAERVSELILQLERDSLNRG